MTPMTGLTAAREFVEHKKNLLDALSLVTVVGTLASWLPSIAAIMSIVWSVIRIYESRTFQRFLSWLQKQGQRTRKGRS